MEANYEYDYIIFLLRGEPITMAHIATQDFALTKAKKVITIFGSDNRPLTAKNPFEAQVRMDLMYHHYAPVDEFDRIIVTSASDNPCNDAFVASVIANVHQLIAQDGGDPWTAKIGFTGFAKEGDTSVFYRDLFTKFWDDVPMAAYPEVEGFGEVRATKVREILFTPSIGLEVLVNVVPPVVLNYLKYFRTTDRYERLLAEYNGVEGFKKALPNFPIQCMTTDAILVCDGYVLLVERGGKVGNGLLAFPGGFIERHLRVEENLYKELGEETTINVPVSELKKAFIGWEIEDAPNRSERCRILTHIGIFDLTILGYNRDNLPTVVGADDAKAAFWLKFEEMQCEDFFEDHYMFGMRCLKKYGFIK